MDELQVLVKALLNLDKKTEIEKIQREIQSDNNARVKIVAGLDIAKSKQLIQANLNTLANGVKAPTINVGVNTSGIQQEINNGISKVKADGKIKIAPVVDVTDFLKNVKSALGVEGADVKKAYQEYVQQLTLNPNDKQAILSSYENLKDNILSAMQVAPESEESWKAFETVVKNCTTSIVEAGNKTKSANAGLKSVENQVKNTSQAFDQLANAEQKVAQVPPAGKSSGNYLYNTTDVLDTIKAFDAESNAIETLKNKFGELGATVSSTEQANSEGFLKKFTVEAKSATGELEKFTYVWKDIDGTGNFQYVLENITAADAGIKKLTDALEKAKAKANQTFEAFNNKSQGLFNNTDVYKNAKQALDNITDNGGIEKFNNAMAELEAHYQKIASYTRSGSKSLNPIINAKNDLAGMDEEIKRIQISYNGLENKSNSLSGSIGSLKTMLKSVNSKEVGTEEWAQAYERLKVKIASVKDQIKTLKLEEKSDNSFAQKQQTMYSVIEQRLKQINSLKIQQMKTDDDTAKIMQEQIDAYQRQVNSINVNMTKYGYRNSDLDKEIEQLKTELDYKIRIAESEERRKLAEQMANGRESAVAERLRQEAQAEKEAEKARQEAMRVAQSQEDELIRNAEREVAEEQRVIEQIEKHREASERARQAEEKRQQIAQSNAINKALEEEYADRQRLAEQMANGREQAEAQRLREQTQADRELQQQEQARHRAEQQAIEKENRLLVIKAEQEVRAEKEMQNLVKQNIDSLNNIKNKTVFSQNANNPQVQQQVSQITALVAKYQEFQAKLNQPMTPESFKALQTELEQLKSEFNQVSTGATNLQQSLKDTANTEKLSNNIKILEARIKAFRQANTKAEGKYGNQFDDLLASLKKCADPATYNQINQNFRRMQAEIKAAGLGGMGIIDDLWAKVKKFSQWMGITMITATIAREIRGLFSTVTELDTALVDLRKTFKGTNEDLQEFYYEANNIAKSLGVSTQEVINEAAAFSRLGYSTKEASAEMAKASAMFKLISPGMGAEQATDGIVSMMKAFKIETEDVVDGILSVVNSVGNAFALNNTDIVEAMTRSSAAMAVANNTIEETIALNTAAKFFG